MGLELLAIALGLSSFSLLLQNRKVVVWSDNVGSQRSTERGRAKAWDHSCIVHVLWLEAACLQMHMHVERVPSEDNIADLPSREARSFIVVSFSCAYAVLSAKKF